MFTYLPIKSLFTRSMKSSALKSMSSLRARQLGGQVVAQPFGVHAQAQVLERVQARAPALLIFSPLFTVRKPCTNTLLGVLRPLKCSMAGQNRCGR